MIKLKYHARAKLPPHKRKPRRHLTAVELNGHIVTYKCLTCEKCHEMEYTNIATKKPDINSARFLFRLHDATSDGRGATGYCPHCAREYRKKKKQENEDLRNYFNRSR